MIKLSSILSLLFLLHVATIKAGESHIEKSASIKVRKGNPKKLKPTKTTSEVLLFKFVIK